MPYNYSTIPLYEHSGLSSDSPYKILSRTSDPGVTGHVPGRGAIQGSISSQDINEIISRNIHFSSRDLEIDSRGMEINSRSLGSHGVEINSRGNMEMSLISLRPNTRYAMVLQAYNSKGAGPSSPAVTAQTKEDSQLILIRQQLLMDDYLN